MIDCFATDHAPHTSKKKTVPIRLRAGLETARLLLLTAVHEGRPSLTP